MSERLLNSHHVVVVVVFLAHLAPSQWDKFFKTFFGFPLQNDKQIPLRFIAIFFTAHMFDESENNFNFVKRTTIKPVFM